MSDTLAVSANETGFYRVFALDLPAQRIDAFTTRDGDTYPLRDALGVTTLDDRHVQILDLTEFKAIGLKTYLSEGLGIAETDYAATLPTLEALKGHVAVIASAAFSPPGIIVPEPPVSLVTVLREEKPHKPLVDLSTPSAQGSIEAATPASPTTAAPLPFWVKLLVAVITLAVLVGLLALFPTGGTP